MAGNETVKLSLPSLYDSAEARKLKEGFARTIAAIVAAAGGSVTVDEQHKQEANGKSLIACHLPDGGTRYTLDESMP